MPVHLPDEERDRVGKYARLSASQSNTYEACPRLWYYEKVLRFKMPQIPVLFVGRAVEETVCRVLKESPSLIVASAPADTYLPTPLDEDGRPSRSSDAVWPCQGMLPLFENERPVTFGALKEWAEARANIHYPLVIERLRQAWEQDDRRAGDWSEVDDERCLAMVNAALEFHLDEVRRCLETAPEDAVSAWRAGQRSLWPAPDGFGHAPFANGHPLACEGSLSLLEAWELARPWFVDPDADSFTMNAVHPDHWFQGEYDLVYRWSGQPVVVDLKASLGANDRSGDYVKQLEMYAMLWYVTHDRKETVGGLQIWYLGHPSIKTVEVPSTAAMDNLETSLLARWNTLKRDPVERAQCPPSPSPMRGFEPGGSPTSPPDAIRCDRCDWRHVCPGGEGSDEFPLEPSVQLPGNMHQTVLSSINTLDPRITVVGELFTVGAARDGRPPRLTLKQGSAFANINIVSQDHHEGGRTWPDGLAKGMMVRVEAAVFTLNWKGEIVLKVDPFARVVADDGTDGEEDLMSMKARHNTSGVVVYRYEKRGVGKTGKPWHRKGLMLLDNTGAMKVEGWANDWNAQYDLVEEGDTIVLENIGLDAWATDVRGDCTRQSRLQIVQRREDSTA